jgi:hypothetical protein
MLIPTIKHYTFGEDLGSTEMEVGVADPLTFLYNRPRCNAVRTSNLSIGTGGDPKLITLEAETIDNDSMYDSATNPSRITFQTTGAYMIGAQLAYASNATGRREVQIRLGAAGSGTGGTRLCRGVGQTTAGDVVLSCQRMITAGVGNYIELFGFQDSGGALNVVGGNDMSFMWAYQIGT